ncbi:class I ribonucleotide reductase maintenance protein YfaE [Vibrio parahaemolyticus]|uniref:class I ribonucleotide reductase maintenance protein YfaE n=1 Tax=Vibrio parahaemolyticus TaxID=670 RepID=UPI002359E886|nr:class I ribonucleotide reductase maintenance protein YfaE [Vibrio parahaemolyticus]WCZ01230.1 2Fe-2S iron-sulfur cluster binding domain-containing protein [Vibrio parahaemolyticus]
MKQITFNEQKVTSSHDQVILDVLDSHNLGAESQCRNGFCGVCRCKLVSGDVKYVNEPLAYFEEGEILPCISIAESDIVLSKHS